MTVHEKIAKLRSLDTDSYYHQLLCSILEDLAGPTPQQRLEQTLQSGAELAAKLTGKTPEYYRSLSDGLFEGLKGPQRGSDE
jgi:hypothetical protein